MLPSRPPKATQRDRGQSVAEGKRSLTRIEHDPEHKAFAELVAQVAKSGEVLGADGGRRLDLHAGDLTAAQLHNHVDLALLLVPIVKERRRAIGPVALT